MLLNRYHDSLYNSLELAVGVGNMPDAISTQSKLKLFLDIGRGEFVKPFDILDKIVPLFKNHSISIVGDVNENLFRGENLHLNINLKLKDDIYTLRNNKGREKTIKSFFKELDASCVWTYYRNDENMTYTLYNGQIYKEITHDEFYKLKITYKNIFIKSNKNSIVEVYDEFLKNSNNLIDISDGLINPFKYSSDSIGSIDIWRRLSKSYSYSDVIEKEEANLLNLSFQGGLLFSKNNYSGFGICYDLNSYYPSLMIDKGFQFPVECYESIYYSENEFNRLSYYKYGIYRAKIIGDDILFKKNPMNIYTHYDLTIAKELGLKIIINTEEEFNFFYYSKEKLVKGLDLFGPFVKKLYELKLKNKSVKRYLNCLYGSLCAKSKYSKIISECENFEVNDSFKINSVDNLNNDTIKINYINKNKLFKTNEARVVFITAYARYRLFKLIKHYKQNICRIHTDSIILDKYIELKTGTGLGEWKIEASGQCFIKNINNIIWN